ncbi:MAG: transcriptional regulator [Erysipelotrichaceae bacterium]|nr:transcriptional regulator [Erysipelotrichaceae bacterium]
MKAKEIAKLLKAVPITYTLWDEYAQEREFTKAFATDLMSDVLAMCQDDFDITVLITGLAADQTFRTLEMLDMTFAILVRGKYPPDEFIQMAVDMDIVLLGTDYSMYEACGILYANGLGGAI